MESKYKPADFGIPQKWMTKDELLAIRPYAALTTTFFNSRPSHYRFLVPLTEKEAIKYCNMKGETYERMKGKTAEEDKEINENLRGFRRSIRRGIQMVLDKRREEGGGVCDGEPEEDLTLYDATDDEYFEVTGGQKIDADDESQGWVLL
ncbi:hypothetical protein ONS95_002119 [Cadophora gregata]|uniref:uncharacterized protein n=1 Tax=Cadophora gregata TaxID=51156 RepID=UPI0026DBDB08|nr:uncharacterized protein ONS95_002119 [Cadophora gregata]KAK0109423.1 hypothetical protein ONS95_002119 [Cadophora gregata]KAK0110948.1 hypothetical protein ONS96_002533 [Cadophora gregata f. sp. sojae]